jgi:hypothetical protein
MKTALTAGSGWRWIVVMTLCSLLTLAAATLSLRALAQQGAAPPAPDSNEEATPDDAAARAERKQRETEEPPDLRESADNNQSFPVDI